MEQCEERCPCPDDDCRDKPCDSMEHKQDGDRKYHSHMRTSNIVCLWISSGHFWFRTLDELKYGRNID